MRLSIFVAVLAAAVGGCTSHDHQAASDQTPTPTAAPTPCPLLAQMYPVSESSFVAHKATFVERQEIEHWYATVPQFDQKNVRWMRAFGITVFVAHPGIRQNNGWYEAWVSLGTNVIFDPVQCEVHAGPPH